MFSWAPEAAAGARLRWGLLLIGGSLGSMILAMLMALLIYFAWMGEYQAITI